MFSNSIKGKLSLLSTSIMIGLILILVISYFQMIAIFNHTNYANTNSIPSILKLNRAFDTFSTLRVRVHRHIIAEDKQAIESAKKQIDESISLVKDAFQQYETLGITDSQDKIYFEKQKQHMQKYIDGIIPVIQLSEHSQKQEASKLLLKDATLEARELRKTFEKHIEYHAKNAKQYADQSQEYKQYALLILIVIGIIILLISLYIINYVIKSLYSQLGGEPRYAIELTKNIADGVLNNQININQNDQSSILLSLRDMQGILKNTVYQIRQNAQNLNSSIIQLMKSSKEVQNSSESQNQSTQVMASTIEQLSVNIESIYQSTHEAFDLTQQSKSFSESSQKVINDAVSQIQSVAGNMTKSMELTQSLSTRSQEINSIVNLISEVAEQTNLLALNAAIEAARAGESGKGFAVVADEVRKLAERTSESTEKINVVIQAIRSDIDKVIYNMNESNQNVEKSVTLAQHANQSIEHIVNSSQQITQLIKDISNDLNEQKTASQLISQNIESVAVMSATNSQSINNTVDVIHDLEKQSRNLYQSIEKFKS